MHHKLDSEGENNFVKLLINKIKLFKKIYKIKPTKSKTYHLKVVQFYHLYYSNDHCVH